MVSTTEPAYLKKKNRVFRTKKTRKDLNFIQRFHSILPFIPFSTSQLADASSSNEKSLLELSLKIIDAILFTSPTAPRKSDILLFYKCILSNTLHMEEKGALIFNKVLQKI